MAAKPPIFGFNGDKARIVSEVVRRVVQEARAPRSLLGEAAFLEIRRQEQGEVDDVVSLSEWRALARTLARATDAECESDLRRIAERYAGNVAGNFDPRVYGFAARAIAPTVGLLMSPLQTLRHFGGAFDMRALDGRVVVQGALGAVRSLAEKGTLVFVPTHQSNLDSVVLGFALERAGLPPATYGAGKNLFANPILSFFMHNLGAYRVDRKLKHEIYKEVLKAYSCVLLERGYHSLFFPGGTRSRSGAIESKLKLGLVGTGVEAMGRSAEAAGARPGERGRSRSWRSVFFVPATINYLLTLEAETLVFDFLQEEGKHRYIIEDDESSRPKRIASFMRKLLGLDAGCVIRFGQPLDCFGNAVDDEGVSHDARGHTVTAESYLTDGDERIRHDPLRDAQYTRELGEAIVASYRRDTVALATHLVSACAFATLRLPSPGAQASLAMGTGEGDLFARLQRRGEVSISRAHLAESIERLRDRALALEARGLIVLGPRLAPASGREILDEGLRAFSGYHTSPVLEPRGEDLVVVDPRLLFYYQNRLAAHGLAENLLGARGPKAGRSRPQGGSREFAAS